MKKPITQTTFSGEVVSHEHMSHQHVSNCIWHFRIWRNAPDISLAHFFRTLITRFNGELLPFRPILRFESEIKALYDCGMVEKVDEYKSNIRWKGNIIGELFNSPEAERAYGEKVAYENELKTIIKKKS